MKLYYLVLIICLTAKYGTCHAEEFDTEDNEDDFEEEEFEEDYADESGDGNRETTDEEKDSCYRWNDLGVLLDVSQSIEPSKFKCVKNYTKSFVDSLSLFTCSRFALAKFSDFANSEVFFNTPDNKERFKKSIDEISGPKRRSWNEVNQSRIDLGLSTANKLLFTTKLGMRTNSEKALVVVTDGIQGPDTGEIDASIAKTLRKLDEKGVRVYVIQLGNDAAARRYLQRVFGKKSVYPERKWMWVKGVILFGKKFDPNLS